MTSLPVIIIGVNPFGLEAAHIFQKNDVVIYGFLDDDPKKKDTSIGEIPVLGTADDESYFKLIGKNCFGDFEEYKLICNQVITHSSDS